jgi:hypothetical protein
VRVVRDRESSVHLVYGFSQLIPQPVRQLSCQFDGQNSPEQCLELPFGRVGLRTIRVRDEFTPDTLTSEVFNHLGRCLFPTDIHSDAPRLEALAFNNLGDEVHKGFKLKCFT